MDKTGSGAPIGGLYCLELDGSVRQVHRNVRVPHAINVSLDQSDGWNLVQLQKLCDVESPVAGNHPLARVNQDGIDESEPAAGLPVRSQRSRLALPEPNCERPVTSRAPRCRWASVYPGGVDVA
jgi:hypothetical protein